MGMIKDLWARLGRIGAPMTISLIGVLLAAYLIPWLMQQDLLSFLGLSIEQGSPSPVTGFLTYPFYTPGIGQDFFWFAISVLWLWMMGTSLERNIGSRTFAILWLTATLIGSLSILIGCLALGV